jgi:hypothetical protein
VTNVKNRRPSPSGLPESLGPFARHLGGRQPDVAEEMIIESGQRPALPAPATPSLKQGSTRVQYPADVGSSRRAPCAAPGRRLAH